MMKFIKKKTINKKACKRKKIGLKSNIKKPNEDEI
jgi:hypothetical protein